MLYIQTRIPHKILEDKIPEDAFTKQKLQVGNFTIFRSPIYIHVHKDKMKKLVASGKRGIFV